MLTHLWVVAVARVRRTRRAGSVCQPSMVAAQCGLVTVVRCGLRAGPAGTGGSGGVTRWVAREPRQPASPPPNSPHTAAQQRVSETFRQQTLGCGAR